jgi:aryl-alcohol dehydrogenase-like predicted oxidoreductase
MAEEALVPKEVLTDGVHASWHLRLKVSRIALGCMSFGDTSRGFSEWALDDAEAEPIFRQALELGITF